MVVNRGGRNSQDLASASTSSAAASGSDRRENTKGSLRSKFLIGEELGFGAFSKVYKGVDLKNGDFVAIKQISLEGLSEDDKDNMVQEIDLLRNLKHKNIVKYLGSYRTKSHLYIILEYVENGSLSQIIKPNKFGAFPESLAAIYMKQTLEGLAYLHEQNVIHRDVKGANILTTKEGTVKLADFGVATMSTQREVSSHSDFTNPVVGTPYWMAPEVIEMSGVTFASDIWSVGATAIELLTGKPPYFDMMPMSALFHIVQDEYPPMPDGISPNMQDFLLKCFQKDSRKRPSARDLLKHDWFKNYNANFDLADSNYSPFAFPSEFEENEDLMHSAESHSLSNIDSSLREDEVGNEGDFAAASEHAAPNSKHNSSRSLRIPFLSQWLSKRTNKEESLKRETRKGNREDFNESSYQLVQNYNVVRQTHAADDEKNTSEPKKIILDRQLIEEVKRLIYMMRPQKREGIIVSACQQAIALFGEHPTYKATFKKYKGIVALQEILSKSVSPSVIHSIIQLLNVSAFDEPGYTQSLTVTGIVPEVFKFISPLEKEFDLAPLRLEASRFARAVCLGSPDSLQLFLACKGIQSISDLMNSMCCSEQATFGVLDKLALVEVAIDCLWGVVNGTDVIHTEDTCRLLYNVGVVEPLVRALKFLSDLSQQAQGGATPESNRSSPSLVTAKMVKLRKMPNDNAGSPAAGSPSSPNVNKTTSEIDGKLSPAESNGDKEHGSAPRAPGPENNGDVAEVSARESPLLLSIAERVTRSSTYPEKAAGLLLIMSCSDNIVRSSLTEVSLLQAIIDSCKSLTGNVQLMILSFLKQLSDEPQFVENLHVTGSVRTLMQLLLELDSELEMQHKLTVLEIIWNMGQFDRSYLEIAASHGLIPCLCNLAKSGDIWLPSVLPLLFSMPSCGRRCRQDLWKNEAPKLFMTLLKNRAWQQKALEALTTWLASDGRIEDFLLGKEVLQEMIAALSDRDTLYALCHQMLLLCHRSPRLSIALSVNTRVLQILVANLINTDASNVLSILRFLDILYAHHPQPKTVVITQDLLERLEHLSQESIAGDMLLVKEKARNMISSLYFNSIM